MVQWQHCRPECWEAWGPEFNPRLGRVGFRFLYKLGQPPKTFISYSLLSVAQLLREITLKSFIFISYHRSCYLCRLHIQKSSPSYVWATLKKGWRNLLKKKKYILVSPCPTGQADFRNTQHITYILDGANTQKYANNATKLKRKWF